MSTIERFHCVYIRTYVLYVCTYVCKGVRLLDLDMEGWLCLIGLSHLWLFCTPFVFTWCVMAD